jgi:AP-1-like transcription factor
MYDLEEFTVKPVSPTSLSDSSTGQKSGNSPISPPAPTTQQVSTKVQNIMMQYQDFTQHHPTTSPATTAAVEGHGFLDCPKVWERIVTHPRFDEVDIEELCAELNSKVRIVSAPGVLI